jgi:hypothetical protein
MAGWQYLFGALRAPRTAIRPAVGRPTGTKFSLLAV